MDVESDPSLYFSRHLFHEFPAANGKAFTPCRLSLKVGIYGILLQSIHELADIAFGFDFYQQMHMFDVKQYPINGTSYLLQY